MDNFLSNYKNYFFRIVIQKLNILNEKNCKPLEQLELQFFFNNLNDNEHYTIIRSLYILEIVTGQKASVFRSRYKYVGSTKKYFFGCKTTLRRTFMYNFLSYVYYVAGPIYLRRQGRFICKSNNKFLKICIDDFAIFPNMNFPEILGFLDCKLSFFNIINKNFFYQLFFFGRYETFNSK